MTCSRACLQGDLPAGVTSSRRGSDCGMDGADRALATGGSSPRASTRLDEIKNFHLELHVRPVIEPYMNLR